MAKIVIEIKIENGKDKSSDCLDGIGDKTHTAQHSCSMRSTSEILQDSLIQLCNIREYFQNPHFGTFSSVSSSLVDKLRESCEGILLGLQRFPRRPKF